MTSVFMVYLLQAIQIRDREYSAVDFNTTWNAYKNGFGDAHGNYWLGKTYRFKMTSITTQML